ncbi:MAG TPA: hypothetical protein VGN47_04575 [Blastococcus sp.]|jgi:hypothetical protein|nr:hypothetical protein [Blastococcus sp.]
MTTVTARPADRKVGSPAERDRRNRRATSVAGEVAERGLREAGWRAALSGADPTGA